MQSGNNLTIFLVSTTIIVLVLVLIILTLLYIYQKKQVEYNQQIILLKSDHDKNILATQIEIQESTLQHIAREIHDNINLTLTLAKLNLYTIDWNALDAGKLKIETTTNLISQTIEDLRDMSSKFHSTIIKNNGLIPALEKELDRIKQIGLFQIHFEIRGEPVYIHNEKEIIAFRIIQEAFNNIIKHSGASLAKVILEYFEKELRIIVQDNGIGITSTKDFLKSKTIGLKNMHTRAFMLGGKMSIETVKYKGTKLLFNIPI